MLNNARIAFDEMVLGGETITVAVTSPPNRCWLTSLTAALGPMAREETHRALTGLPLLGALALSGLVELIGKILRIDAAVYPEHRLLSTSLYDGKLPVLFDHISDLQTRYPDKALILRSLTDAPAVGVLWPLRLVWIIDDVQRDWAPRRDVHRDQTILAQSGLVATAHGGEIDDAILERCLELYRGLYIDAYSAFNPDYTAGYIRQLLRDGRLEIHTLAGEGGIAAFCAAHCDRETMTLPMLGYDRDRPQDDGLYRAVMAHMGGLALARGLKLNLSAGAPHFKRHRGATPWMEYLLIIDHHLPAWRRLGYRLIAWILRRLEPHLRQIAQEA